MNYKKNTITQPLPLEADLEIPYIAREFYNHTLNGDFKIFGETTIPEKTNIKVFINGIEQV